MLDLEAIKRRMILPLKGETLAQAIVDLITEVERLQRIEQAAREHLKEWESGDTMAHDTRKALKEALRKEQS